MESVPGQGTVFRIELPVEAALVAVLAPPPVEILPTPQKGAILVVDDESGITSALEYLLQCDGYQSAARRAADAASALMCCKRYASFASHGEVEYSVGNAIYL